MILEHYCESIRASYTYHGLGECFDRIVCVFLVVVIHQLDYDLGIRIAVEGVAVAQQLFLQLGKVLDNAVMHHRIPPMLAEMRMGVARGGRAVRRPARMPNSDFILAFIFRQFFNLIDMVTILEIITQLIVALEATKILHKFVMLYTKQI